MDEPTSRARPVVGAVLVGGRGRRMGGPKALLEVEGVPLGERVVGALRAGGAAQVLAVGGDRATADRLGVAHLPDERPDEGPLAAIATALAAVASSDPDAFLVVAPCDLPDLRGSDVAQLVEGLADAEVAVPGPPRQPLPSAWRVAAADTVGDLVASGARRAAAPLAHLRVCEVALPPSATGDLDTPEDLQRRRSASESTDRAP